MARNTNVVERAVRSVKGEPLPDLSKLFTDEQTVEVPPRGALQSFSVNPQGLPEVGQILTVDTEQLKVPTWHPRKVIKKAQTELLRAQIGNDGQQTPIDVFLSNSVLHEYEILDGARIHDALIFNRIDTAIIRVCPRVDEFEAIRQWVAKHLGTAAVTDLDYADAVARMVKLRKNVKPVLRFEQIAAMFDVSRQTVYNWRIIAELPEYVKAEMQQAPAEIEATQKKDALTTKHALALHMFKVGENRDGSPVYDESAQQAFLSRIRRDKLSGDAALAEARAITKPALPQQPEPAAPVISPQGTIPSHGGHYSGNVGNANAPGNSQRAFDLPNNGVTAHRSTPAVDPEAAARHSADALEAALKEIRAAKAQDRVAIHFKATMAPYLERIRWAVAAIEGEL